MVGCGARGLYRAIVYRLGASRRGFEEDVRDFDERASRFEEEERTVDEPILGDRRTFEEPVVRAEIKPEPKPEPPVPVPEPEPEEPEEPVVTPAKMLNTGNPLVALLAAFVLIGLGLKRREEE